uniref:WW domain-containing protein n=1 Tax=Noctiluca scintillans TaxID=2966 RepID=A0A7S0ZQY8_NOCSC|mmetsp:Transcript_15207/g.41715  ORF Transcript_15207/g.41715 Transcript_15207/m.41715 type:complete len:529 (+) Transcript_15207:100-1686(+)
MIRRALKPALSSASRLQLNAAFLRSSVTRPRLSQFLRPNATDAQSTQDTGISTIPSPSTARSEQVMSSTQQTIPPPQVSASAVQNEAAASVSEVAGIPSMPAPTTSDGAKSQPSTMPTKKSLEEESKQVKLCLPMVREPKTGRPTASNFETGAFLRVEWNGAWWRAAVKETTETEVKVGFSTWSNSHDEWLPKVSDRLRIAETEEPESRPPLFSPGYELPVAKPFVNKGPFVPKPYDPEREFQKRQQRLREKIAVMQKNKLGRVDPTLEEQIKAVRQVAVEAMKRDENSHLTPAATPSLMPRTSSQTVDPSLITSPVATAESVPALTRPQPRVDTRQEPRRAKTVSADVGSGGIPGPPPSAPSAAPMVTNPTVAAAIPGPPPRAPSATPSSTSAEAIAVTIPDPPPSPSGTSQKPLSPTAVPTQLSGSGSTEVASGGISGPSASVEVQTVDAEVISKSSQTPAAPGHVAVRWEEVLSKNNERYYVEIATGNTQWELPTAGWVQLVHEDGARYFWHVDTGTRQWTAPKV